jgi:hypothetical protein
MKVFDTPVFQNEQEEAEWWDAHQDELADAFEEAAANGTLRMGTVAREGVGAFHTLAKVGPTLPEAKQKSAA